MWRFNTPIHTCFPILFRASRTPLDSLCIYFYLSSPTSLQLRAHSPLTLSETLEDTFVTAVPEVSLMRNDSLEVHTDDTEVSCITCNRNICLLLIFLDFLHLKLSQPSRMPDFSLRPVNCFLLLWYRLASIFMMHAHTFPPEKVFSVPEMICLLMLLW